MKKKIKKRWGKTNPTTKQKKKDTSLCVSGPVRGTGRGGEGAEKEGGVRVGEGGRRAEAHHTYIYATPTNFQEESTPTNIRTPHEKKNEQHRTEKQMREETRRTKMKTNKKTADDDDDGDEDEDDEDEERKTPERQSKQTTKKKKRRQFNTKRGRKRGDAVVREEARAWCDVVS